VLGHLLEHERVKFYEEAEQVLSRLPRLAGTYDLAQTQGWRCQIIRLQHSRAHRATDAQKARAACRHGGMTELEEAELTEGQGRALSAHRAQQSSTPATLSAPGSECCRRRKRHPHRGALKVPDSTGQTWLAIQ